MVGGELVRSLLDNKHDVVLVEQHKETCDRLYAETGVVAIHGCATSIEALKEAGISKADVVVAATGGDADNLACALLAKSFEVPRVIARMRDPAYKNAYVVAGVNSIVRVTDLMVNQMMVDIENPTLRRITTIGGGKADIFMVNVPEGEQFSIPRGKQIIKEGDELFLISAAEDISKAVDFLTAKNKT
jgi:trk system potassium uptake protein TrkA